MNVIYAPRAQRDLKHIEAYLTEHNPAAALKTLGAIKSSLDTLSLFPQIGRPVDMPAIDACRCSAILISSSIV